jgi:hypothetical protein
MQFWDDPVTEDDHRRAREAGEAATRRQALADGHATYRLLHMKEPPYCSSCGRRFAFTQFHGKLYCGACAPQYVEPINPYGEKVTL